MRDKVCLFLRGVRVAARVPLSGADPARGSPAYARAAARDRCVPRAVRGSRRVASVPFCSVRGPGRVALVPPVRCLACGAWRVRPLCGAQFSACISRHAMRAPCGTQAAEYGAHGVSCARFVSEGMVSVMAALDILAPVLVIVAAIAAVAIAYLAFTALKDRSDRRRDEELMNGYRSKRR